MYGSMVFSQGRPVRLGPSASEVVVDGLNGLSDLGATRRWVQQMAGQLTADGVLKQVQRKLCVSKRGAAETLKLANDDTPVTPQDVMTAEGATRIARAGKKQQANARFHHDRATKAKKRMEELLARSKKLTNPTLKAKLETDAALQARELLAEQVSASRSATAAGAALAALKFRSAAINTKDARKQRNLFGQAAASVDAGNQVAQTKVKVTLPEALSRESLRARAIAGGILPNPETMSRERIMPTGTAVAATRIPATRPPTVMGPQGLLKSPLAQRLNLNAARFLTPGSVPPSNLPVLPFQADIPQPITGVNSLPVNVPALLQSPAQTDPIIASRTATAQLAGLDGLGSFDLGGLLGAIGQVAGAAFPANSTVGQAVAGAANVGAAAVSNNWGGAIASAVATVGNIISPPPPQPPGSPPLAYAPQPQYPQTYMPPLQTTQQQQVYQTIANSTHQVTPPGMQSPMASGGMPGWVLPVAGVGAAGLLAFALLA